MTFGATGAKRARVMPGMAHAVGCCLQAYPPPADPRSAFRTRVLLDRTPLVQQVANATPCRQCIKPSSTVPMG